MTNWKQYDSKESIDVLKDITRSEQQCRELLEAARDSGAFCEHVRSLVDAAKGGRLFDGKEPPQFDKMSEGEFKNMSWQVQGETLWSALGDMPPVDACRPGLWLYITLCTIEQGAIESHFLAAGTNGTNATGLSQIDDALKGDIDRNGTPAYLRIARLILRRSFGAIRERRGIKAVFTDIPFARIWWQRHIAEEIASGGADIDADKMIGFLTTPGKGGIYEELTMRMSSSMTAIGDRPVRDGLMHFFYHAALGSKCPDKFNANTDGFKALVRRLGIMLSWRAMGVLDAMKNSDIAYQCAAEIGRGEFS